MIENPLGGKILPAVSKGGFFMDDYFIWDSAVIYADGQYHMFCSRWKKELGFGHSWLFFSQIVRAVSDTPEGPYHFANVVFERRGKEFFDGMNTHNTCIRKYGGKYYLYYMGTTYGGEINLEAADKDYCYPMEVWNRKRIGVAVADKITGPFIRKDVPLFLPRDCSHWDCTCTTNPAVAILPDGTTYMIYKSRTGYGYPLQLGVARADRPDGVFVRLTEDPIFQFEDPKQQIEDPYLWYDAKRKKFCAVIKDATEDLSHSISQSGVYGSGFYAESDDCIHWDIPEHPTIFTKNLLFDNGETVFMSNLERPWVLFGEDGTPTHIFCATGAGGEAYKFSGTTGVVCIPLKK